MIETAKTTINCVEKQKDDGSQSLNIDGARTAHN